MKLNEEIEEELRRLEANTLLTMDRTHCFTVHSGYFSDLTDKIRSNVEWESSTVLSRIGNHNPFSIPDSYFDGLAENIKSNVIGRVPAKVVPMHAPKIRKFRSYFMAASIAALLGVLGVYFWQKNSFSNIPNGNFSTAGLEGISEESLNNYLKETNFSSNIADNQEILLLSHSYAENNLKELLHEMPEEDLVYYTNEFL